MFIKEIFFFKHFRKFSLDPVGFFPKYFQIYFWCTNMRGNIADSETFKTCIFFKHYFFFFNSCCIDTYLQITWRNCFFFSFNRQWKEICKTCRRGNWQWENEKAYNSWSTLYITDITFGYLGCLRSNGERDWLLM